MRSPNRSHPLTRAGFFDAGRSRLAREVEELKAILQVGMQDCICRGYARMHVLRVQM